MHSTAFCICKRFAKPKNPLAAEFLPLPGSFSIVHSSVAFFFFLSYFYAKLLLLSLCIPLLFFISTLWFIFSVVIRSFCFCFHFTFWSVIVGYGVLYVRKPVQIKEIFIVLSMSGEMPIRKSNDQKTVCPNGPNRKQ